MFTQVKQETDLTSEQSVFLEGTGSIVFDFVTRRAFACLSPRTSASLVRRVCDVLDFEPVLFEAVDDEGNPVYHTNVMMWVGTRAAAVCFESIKNLKVGA